MSVDKRLHGGGAEAAEARSAAMQMDQSSQEVAGGCSGRVLPAIVSDVILLPHQRGAINVEWDQNLRALRAASKRRSRQMILLPLIQGRSIESLTAGALVEVELTNLDTEEGQSIDAFAHAAAEVRVTKMRPYVQVRVVGLEKPDPEPEAELRLLVSQTIRRISGRKSYDHFADLLSTRLTPREAAGAALRYSSLPLPDAYEVLAARGTAGRLQMIDALLKQKRQKRRRRSWTSKNAEPPAEDRESQLPEQVRQAIEEERGRGGWESHSQDAIDFALGMQWTPPAPPLIDLEAARRQFDAECYGLDVVKEELLDLLATWEWARRQGHRETMVGGKVICLVGPPGVGKTSVARVLASAMGRELIRIPMGSANEVTLTGSDQAFKHARAGEIVRRIRQSKRHPSELVFLLDELDKLPDDKTYPPLPALLALLDPEQQHEWRDRFLDAIPVDVSGSVFIGTANDIRDLAPPLLDRLQPLSILGYARDAQITIGRAHLVPRLWSRLRLGDAVQLEPDVIPALVDAGPKSPGMRQLKAQLETVVSRALRRRLEEGNSVVVTADQAVAWVRPAYHHPGLGFRPRRSEDSDGKGKRAEMELVGTRAGDGDMSAAPEHVEEEIQCPF